MTPVARCNPYGSPEEARNPKAGQRPTFTRSEGVSRDACECREGDGAPCHDCESSPAGVCPYHVEAARLLLWYAEAALKLNAASRSWSWRVPAEDDAMAAAGALRQLGAGQEQAAAR
jgi:hypothetical protein